MEKGREEHSETLQSESATTFSSYGNYEVKESLSLRLPGTQIQLQKLDENHFSYFRKDSEQNTEEKIIQSTTGALTVQLCPVLPLNLPAKKTNDLIFLRLAQQLFVSAKSNMDIVVQFPIEIAIYVKMKGSSDMLDVITCEPMHSRFALYGTPEGGRLCMYSKVSLVGNKELDPYIWARMKISIQNELNHGTKIGKFVFPLTGHQVYYKENTSEVHIDDLGATIYSESAGERMELKQIDFSRKQEKWQLAPPMTSKQEAFVMEKGFD